MGLAIAVIGSPVMPRVRGALVALALGAILSTPAPAAVRLDPLQNDFAQYLVYAGSRLLGTEKFSLEPQSDSVAVFSNVDEWIPSPDGDKKLVKKIQLIIKALDYDMLGYTSEQDFLGRKLTRGLVLSDTAFTSYRELDGHGAGDRYVRPPGRMFVIDSQVFVLFDVLMRSLHGKPVDARTLPVCVLGAPRDTVLDVSLRPEPKDEPLTWGARTVSARRYTLSDGNSEFIAWIGADGRMLQLEQPASGLRVVRDPKPPKKASGNPGSSNAGPAKSTAAKSRSSAAPAAKPPAH
jgi:hypothetical protein